MSGHGPRPTPRSLIEGVVALLVLVLGLWLLRVREVTGGPLLSLGLLIVAGAVAGRIAAFLSLPRLTGYLLAGIVAGPHVTGAVSGSDVKALSLVNGLALALIALQAGAEITLPVLARTWRSVLWSSFFQSLVIVMPMALVFAAVAPQLGFLDGRSFEVTLAVGAVWGCISLSRSPAVTLAILGETRAKGPVTDHALGVVVLLDVLVLVLFAIAVAFAKGAVEGDPIDVGGMVHLGEELWASVAAGVTFGVLIAALLRVVNEKALLITVLGYGVTALCVYLVYDTLLVFVVAGFVVMNLTKRGPELVHTSEQVSGVVMIAFFATAGAKLDLEALTRLWPLALLFVATRLVLTLVATQLGHRLAKDPPVVRRWGWTSLVSQAGVTIGLATLVAEGFPAFGSQLASLTIAVVGIHELIGPVIFKFGLTRAGELGGGASAAEQAGVDATAPSATS